MLKKAVKGRKAKRGRPEIKAQDAVYEQVTRRVTIVRIRVAQKNLSVLEKKKRTAQSRRKATAEDLLRRSEGDTYLAGGFYTLFIVHNYYIS